MANKIDAIGTLKGALEIGITRTDAVSELVDNTFDAKGTDFRFRFNNDLSAYYYDNGNGMSKYELNRAAVINNRSDANNYKQGCKGVGMNNAMAIFTKLQSEVTIISRKIDEKMVDMLIDYPECLEFNIYNPSARTDPSRVSEELFEKFVNRELQSETGTVISFPKVDPDVYYELTEAIKSNQIEHSLLYEVGVKYLSYIEEGKCMKFIIQDETEVDYEYEVFPIDPLCRHSISSENKSVTECELYINRSYSRTQTRSYFTLNGNRVYTKNIQDCKQYPAEETIPHGWTFIGSYTIYSAYSPDWLNEQVDIIERIEEIDTDDEVDDSISRVGKKAIEKRKHTKQEFMGGRFYKRNQKIITRVPIVDKKSGDFAERPFHNNSRHILNYPVELDEYMDTQINKSVLREENIDKSIKNAYKIVRTNFAHKQYELSIPQDAPAHPRPIPEVQEAVSPILFQESQQVPIQSIPQVQVPTVLVQEPTLTLIPSSSIAPQTTSIPVQLHSLVSISSSSAQSTRIESDSDSEIESTNLHQQSILDESEHESILLPDPEPVRQHLRTTLPKIVALSMLDHLNATPHININDKYSKILIEILCISNGKGGDTQLARQISFISNNDYTRLAMCLCDYYNRNYSDSESVCGGSLLLSFYREIFPNSELLVATA
jgi:Histidine kinase-, DNA gyrase B-, and HSP90-like ATPase